MTAPVDAALARLRASMPTASQQTLHNLLYLAYGFHLAEALEPLFLNDLLARPGGAEVGQLRPDDHYQAAATLTAAEESVIDQVVKLYGPLSEDELVAAVRATDSWDEAHRGGWVICLEVIRDEFSRMPMNTDE